MSCPGWYCGKVRLPNDVFSECGPCPRGFRRNETTFICEECTDIPSFYDWLYLGFQALLLLVLHCYFIDKVSLKRCFRNNVIILHASAFVEVTVASLLAIILSNPLGYLQISSCRVRRMSDWYTLFHNPTPNYEKKVYCTQEAVYPLYTTVFMFYGLSLLMMILIRPLVSNKFLMNKCKMSIFAAMYFIPILVLMHALVGGLLYYCFPHLVLILSVISCAAHFSIRLDQDVNSLIVQTITKPRHLIILLGHWFLHAYGLISLTRLENPPLHTLFILLVPLPTLFYIFTARFTDPTKVHFWINNISSLFT